MVFFIQSTSNCLLLLCALYCYKKSASKKVFDRPATLFTFGVYDICSISHEIFLQTSCKRTLKMVKIALQVKATLECIEKLYTNHPHYQWFLKLKCGNCGEVTLKFHDLTEADKVPQKHNRSETNLLIKCKMCSRENSIDVIEGSNGKLTTTFNKRSQCCLSAYQIRHSIHE